MSLSAAPPQSTASGPQTGPKIWLNEAQSVPANHVGAPAATGLLVAGQAAPLSVTSADVNEDGVADLLVGYSTPAGGVVAVHRGNLDAFAPQSDASFQAIGRSQFPAPFLPDAQAFSVPVRPDFLAAGNFTGKGHLDFVAAAKGGSTLYVFAGDGKGGFGAPQTIDLNGAVTALAAGKFGAEPIFDSLFLALTGPQNNFSLALFQGSQQGLSSRVTLSTPGVASSIVFGDFGDIGPDAAFVAGGQVVLLHSSSLQLESLNLPVSPVSIALGTFVSDRVPGLQIAVLATDGSIQIAAHNEFDPRVFTLDELKSIRQARLRGQASPLVAERAVPQKGWKIVEVTPSAAPFSPGQTPVMFRTRISSNGGDDVMVLNPSMGQLSVVSHTDPQPGAATFIPGAVSVRPYAGSAVTALPMRVNIDGRPGVVALHQGQIAPAVMMPLPDPTFFVNRTDDPVPGTLAATCNNVSNADTSSSCSLREAVLKANATAGTDTIQLAAGTYTLSQPRVAGDFTAQHGTLDITDSVNIVGAGQATTIIQAGTTNANGVDKVFSFNQDIAAFTTASVSLSNLTIRFGLNCGDSTVRQDGFGGAFDFDTGGTTPATATATLTVTNVTITDNSITDGLGGGVATFNTNNGTGFATFTNCIVQNNTSHLASGGAGNGGGIFVGQPGRIVLNNTQVLNNLATQVAGASKGQGGGLWIVGSATHRQSAIHGGVVSGNQAAGDGGGVYSTAGLVIDTGTVISNNTAGGDGGGLWYNALGETASVSKVTITGNSATGAVFGGGGGIVVGNATGTVMNLSFSRVAGNTAPAGKNLFQSNSPAASSVTATNNWWGTNTPSSTINLATSPCPPAAGQICYDPFIALTHTASPATIRINQSTTLTGDMSKDNHGVGTALTGNLDVLVGLPITFNNPVLGTIPQAQPETLSAGAQATATFNAGGTGGAGHADATVDQATVTANIVVLEPLQITKSFSPATVAVNAPSTLIFSANNPNVVAVDANFTDTLPAGLVVATTPSATNTCGGTVTAVAGAGSIAFSNAALAVGACTITVNVQGSPDGVYNNSVTINSTAAGTGAQSTSTASLTVINPPAITKSFVATTLPLNGQTTLSFSIQNPNTVLGLTGVSFTDSLPSGMVVAPIPNVSNNCGGTVTAVAGASSASLSGGALAAGAGCAVTVNVQGTTAGVKNNSVQVSSTNGGTGNTGNASITIVAPPVIIKAFGAASIPLNGSTSLTFTIQNNNTTATLNLVGFLDSLPAGLVVSIPNGLTGTCGGGTITATQGTGTINLSGAVLAQSSSCTFSVNVTGTAAGTQNNTTGQVTSTEGGVGGTASASINVVGPPFIAKVFNPAGIALNATTSLTFTITNPAANAVSLTGVAFTDALPTGLTVANASATVCGGTLTTTAPTGIALSGATIAANSQCQFSVTVTGAAVGNYTNTTGNVTSTNGGTGNTASANLTVATPPTITKAFAAASIPLNGTTSLTFSITNPNTNVALTGLAFTDNLPAGLVVATPNGLSSTCGGTATAVAGASSASLTAGTVAASGSCTVSVNIQGITAGVKNNSVQVTSTEGGTGNTSNASITVVGPPVIIKAFGAASMPLSGSTSLTFTIQNNNTTTTLTGIGFSDTFPAGLVVSTPNGVTGTCGGGTITATQATNVISLSGATLAASTSCTFSVNVTGTAAGTQNNTTGNVTSVEGGTGGTASASIAVVAPPAIAKAFNPTATTVNGTSTLTFTITNPAANTVAEAGVAFTDTLPAGMVVATPNGLTNTCGGTATATAGSGSISLTGGTIAASSNCALTVNVTASSTGTFTNTTGNVTSTNGGTGNTASANLTVQPADLTITKTHTGTFTRGQTGAIWTITVANSGAGPTVGTVTVVDTLPSVTNPPVPTAISGTGWTCTLATLTCTRSDALAPGASYPAITLTVNIPINIPNNFTNTATVSGGGETNTGNDTATDAISLGPPLIITPHAATTLTLTAGSSGTIAFDVTDSDPSVGTVGFTCAGLPAGAACSFNPASVNVGTTTVTMTITTTGKSSGIVVSGRNIDWTPNAPFYALLFPAAGIAIATLSVKKDRRRKLRGLAGCAVMMSLLVLAGCGTSHHAIVTPPGTYQITVTAVTPTLQVSTPITLTVQ